MEFQVGDRVMIRYWDDMCEEFGCPEDKFDSIKLSKNVFTSHMIHLCGRKATISDIDESRIGLDDWNDDAGDTRWVFTKDMLVLVSRKPKIKEMTLEEIEEQLGYKFAIVSSK